MPGEAPGAALGDVGPPTRRGVLSSGGPRPVPNGATRASVLPVNTRVDLRILTLDQLGFPPVGKPYLKASLTSMSRRRSVSARSAEPLGEGSKPA